MEEWVDMQTIVNILGTFVWCGQNWNSQLAFLITEYNNGCIWCMVLSYKKCQLFFLPCQLYSQLTVFHENSNLKGAKLIPQKEGQKTFKAVALFIFDKTCHFIFFLTKLAHFICDETCTLHLWNRRNLPINHQQSSHFLLVCYSKAKLKALIESEWWLQNFQGGGGWGSTSQKIDWAHRWIKIIPLLIQCLNPESTLIKWSACWDIYIKKYI